MANLLFSVDTKHFPANHKRTKRLYFTQMTSTKKNKGTLFSSTFKVKEYKVNLFFLFEVNLLRYSEFEESSVSGPEVDPDWMWLCQFVDYFFFYILWANCPQKTMIWYFYILYQWPSSINNKHTCQVGSSPFLHLKAHEEHLEALSLNMKDIFLRRIILHAFSMKPLSRHLTIINKQ